MVSYAIGGLIAFALMACLAEITVQHATSGSFGAYAELMCAEKTGGFNLVN
ncbi:hypothetical protein ACFDAZ_14680 [Enterococcus lactis]|uniref:hypothetical protein n=1 Tax=Enterococcus lactis TaxID=357441 RepID=UPI0039A57550